LHRNLLNLPSSIAEKTGKTIKLCKKLYEERKLKTNLTQRKVTMNLTGRTKGDLLSCKLLENFEEDVKHLSETVCAFNI